MFSRHLSLMEHVSSEVVSHIGHTDFGLGSLQPDGADEQAHRPFHVRKLSPRIQSAILDGKQPVDLTLEKIVRTRLPYDWRQQERLLGFDG